jgi:regulator of sirC expression with transglutaminase-like and TPR domain
MPVRPVSHPLALERLADARLAGGDVDPLAAAIAIATHHSPTLKPDLIRAEVEGFARDVRHFVKHENPMALAVNHVLFERNGLHGERENYSDPANSYVNCVIERKRGLPILLCLLWVQTVLRAGGKAHGIGLPGHFIVALDVAEELGEGRIYLDPFNRGMQMSQDDCYRVAMAAGVAWHAEFLQPVSGMQWAIRMLNNLRNAYHERGDAANTAAVLEQLLLLDPENAVRKKELQKNYEVLDSKRTRNN